MNVKSDLLEKVEPTEAKDRQPMPVKPSDWHRLYIGCGQWIDIEENPELNCLVYNENGDLL